MSARGLFLLTIDDFFFFCSEFGIDAFRPACAMEGRSSISEDVTYVTRRDGCLVWRSGSSADQYYVFDTSTRFVGIQFLELGGDHLDRLMTFATHQHVRTHTLHTHAHQTSESVDRTFSLLIPAVCRTSPR